MIHIAEIKGRGNLPILIDGRYVASARVEIVDRPKTFVGHLVELLTSKIVHLRLPDEEADYLCGRKNSGWKEWSYYHIEWSVEYPDSIDLSRGYEEELAKKRMCKPCVNAMKALTSGTVKALVLSTEEESWPSQA